jgi:ASC-1-like (ASCH) protein
MRVWTMKVLAEVEIVRDGSKFIARLTYEGTEAVEVESTSFEELLEQVANELQDRYGFL